MDILDKRLLAYEILDDNMSDHTEEHLKRVHYLKEWIVDAMVEYSDKINNVVLDDVNNSDNDKCNCDYFTFGSHSRRCPKYNDSCC